MKECVTAFQWYTLRKTQTMYLNTNLLDFVIPDHIWDPISIICLHSLSLLMLVHNLTFSWDPINVYGEARICVHACLHLFLSLTFKFAAGQILKGEGTYQQFTS